jgi:toxin ParE1/3/4
MKILWLVAAERDLVALTDFIAEDNPRTAVKIFHTILLTVDKLASYPDLGRAGRIEHTRELVIPHLPYIIVYTFAEEIRILAIIHTSRKWPSAF